MSNATYMSCAGYWGETMYVAFEVVDEDQNHIVTM